MLTYIKIFVPTLVFSLCLDFLWLALIAKSYYGGQLGSLLQPNPMGTLPRIVCALFVYILICGGIVFFVLPPIESPGNFLQVALKGAFFGLVLYGVYEFTNFVMVRDWPASIVVVDLCWGVFLCTVTSVFALFLKNYLTRP